MAQIAITKILDGPRNAVFHIAIAGSGAGDLSDEVVIDPASSFDPALPATPSMTIDRLWYDLTGFDARLEFDHLLTNTLVWTMTGDQYVEMDCNVFGGLKDRSNALDGTGKLTLFTTGLGAGEYGTLIVKVRKD